jgi:hypothetical protein
MGPGMGMGMMPIMGAGGYGVGHGQSPYYPYSNNNITYAGYPNHHGYNGHTGYYGGPHHFYNQHYNHGWYANYFFPFQSPHMYGTGGIGPYYGYSNGLQYAVPAAGQTQYAYVRAAATPKALPREYYTKNYNCRLREEYREYSTREHVDIENRRVATERGAYRPRRIKPADARPSDLFWCRERDGQWTLRKYYQIEDNCYPGTWKMDAEIGFLVFHRD